MKVWFDGKGEVACDLAHVERLTEDPGELFVELVKRMPGLSEVTLIEQGTDFVKIRTNEGLMTRSNISRSVESDCVVIEFDEVYKAGSVVTASSHFRDAYSAHEGGVQHHLVISGLSAPGIVGFLYRSFGSKSIGKAVLQTNKSYFEGDAP